jgi:hypothetical protein
MSAEEFWKDDPQLFVSYRTSFFNKKKREMEELDYKCWLNGLYNYDGNSKLMASLKQLISNIMASFSKGQRDNSKIESYPKKPYTELEKEKTKPEKVKDKHKDYHDSLMYFGSIKQIYLDRMLNKNKEKGE